MVQQNIRYQAQQRKQNRDNKQYKFNQPDELKQQRILLSTIEQLRDMLITQQTTSEELVNVFAQRCYTIGRQHNFLAEEYYNEALQIARLKDLQLNQAIQNSTIDQLGKFHGIPISIKDHINEKGKINTIGCEIFANNIAQYDATIIQIMIGEGAIPMVRGNVPQLVLCIHTKNNIYGESLNPFDKTRSCSGSSGGDAGIIATRCAPLSIGTDVGGSIRVPASFTGVFGFKPTPQRVSYQGCILPIKTEQLRQVQIQPATGPLSYFIDDIIYFMKTTMKEKHLKLDKEVVPIQFSQQLFDDNLNKKLKIGFLSEYPFLPASQSVKRSIQLVKNTLEQNGHQLIEFNLSEQENNELIDIYYKIMFIGSLHCTNQVMKDTKEQAIEEYQEMILFYKQNYYFQKCLKKLVPLLKGQRQARIVSNLSNYYSPFEIDDILYRRQKFCQNFNKKYQEHNLDGIISPTFATCSFKNVNSKLLASFFNYCFLWNVVDYPTGVVPVTEVQPGEDKDYQDNYNDLITQAFRETVQGSLGMPIGIQVSTQKWQDEKCLAIMKQIDQLIKFKKEY